MFGFAGLWERWVGYDERIESCSILVTEANDIIRPVHDRMPVIVSPEDYYHWLNPALTDGEQLTGLLRPYAVAAMVAYPVTRRVNNPAYNDAGWIEPLT